MRKTLFLSAICLFLISCEKEAPLTRNDDEIVKRELNSSEIILRDNLRATAILVADILQDETVMDEFKAISAKGRTSYSLYFKDLMNSSEKGSSFRIFREKFIGACTSKGQTEDGTDLSKYLAENDCYLYCPYPDEFYPEGISNFTVAGHPIDNEYEGVGFVFDQSGKLAEATVDEEYTDENPVLLIMPRDKDQEGDPNVKGVIDLNGSKGEINEVRIGYLRCADYCGGLFEGTLELRIGRGYPTFNSATEGVSGTFAALIGIDYPKDYAKAAIKKWNSYCNGGWFAVNIVWDTDWKVEEVQQGILAYEYDHAINTEVSTTVGYKKDEFSATQTAKATTTYQGDFLGINEWDRNWFFRTNRLPGPGEFLVYGWTTRSTCTVLKFTTPARVIYY